MCPSEFVAQEMKDKLPGMGDEQTGSCPFPVLLCLPAPPACQGISQNILYPRHLPAVQGSCLIQPGAPTLIASSSICNIGVRSGSRGMSQPLPGAALGFAPCDPSTSREWPHLHRRRENFPALPNVLGSANLPYQPRWAGKRSSQKPFAT